MISRLLATWVPDEAFIDDVVRRATSRGVASFDIFDTALTRAFDSPADVFAEVERRLVENHGRRARGFAHAREEAERCARTSPRTREDITFDDIYRHGPRCLPSFGAWEDAKLVELAVEAEHLEPVPDILTITSRLEAMRVPFVFVSDMYHSASTLCGWLTRAGYKGWAEVFVSSETGVTKGSGAMWEHVKRRYGKGVLHVGDDRCGDVVQARAAGIEPVHYTRAVSARRTGARLAPPVVTFSRWQRHVDLEGRRRGFEDDRATEWRRLGRTVGGMVLGAFVRWLAGRVRQHRVERLYFCARDGYLMKRAWDVAGLGASIGVESRYLYVSRAVLNLASGHGSSRTGALSAELLDFATTTTPGTSARTALRRARLERIPSVVDAAKRAFGSLDCPLERDDVPRLREFFTSHSGALLEALEAHATRTFDYLAQEGLRDTGKHAIVDMGWHGTMQRSLNALLPERAEPVLGFYYGLWPAASRHRYLAGVMEACFGSEFLSLEEQAELHQSVALLEELHMAPEGSTLGFTRDTDGRLVPELADSPAERAQHATSTGFFQEGALETVAEVFAPSREGPLTSDALDREAALAALGAVFLSPTDRELELLRTLGHCSTFDHATLEPIVRESCPSERREAEAVYLDSDWRIGQLLTWNRSARDADRRLARELADQHLAFLGPRRLRVFG
jgi:FMN phosphatase YigB (HAD superfamily)